MSTPTAISDAHGPERARDGLFLAFVLVIAALARLWGLGFGLPNTNCRPDEMVVISKALAMGTGDLNPHFFRYPSLYLYLLFAAYGAFYVAGRMSGKFGGVSDFITGFAVDPSPFVMIDRFISALCGVMTVMITYYAAKAFFNRRTARFASFFLALAYLPARDSHFGVTDTPAACLIMAAVLFLGRAFKDDRVHNYALAGIFSGLAASTKYLGVIMIAPAALVSLWGKGRRARASALFDRRLILFGALLLAAFLAGTPFSVLDHTAFLTDFRYELGNVVRETGSSWWDRGWFFHLWFTLFYGLGPPMLAAAAIGAIVAVKRDWKKAAVLFTFPLVYYLAAGKGFRVYVRYMEPVIPFLCIAAAAFAEALIEATTKKVPAVPRLAWAAAVALAVVSGSVPSLYHFDMLLTKKDNRLLVRDWVLAHVPQGSTVLEQGPMYSGLLLPESVPLLQAKIEEKKSPARTRYYRAIADYHERNNITGYSLWEYDQAGGGFAFAGTPVKGDPDYMIIGSAPIADTHPLPAEISSLLNARYREIASFPAAVAGTGCRRYDTMDAFYVPYVGFCGVERPGPAFTVYKRKEAALNGG